jgi:lactate dehydrogenase-like 2-hydroxyacid dehydrogenase
MSRPRIVVARVLPEPALDMLRKAGEVWVSPHDRPLERAELIEAVRGADALVVLVHDRVDEGLLEAAGERLRVVATVAVGYDNVDVGACARRGVAVANTPGVLTEATADLAMALILMVTRRLGEGERLVRSGQRWDWGLDFLLGAGIQGRTLGIVGLGRIGEATARRALAFGMRIAYAGRRRASAGVEAVLGATFRDLDDLFAESDVVSLHVPLNAGTRHLVDAARLRRMRPTAYLVNTARGPVVDEDALVEALTSGVIAGAGLDVYEQEPEVPAALLGLENVVLLPHLGSATRETRTAMALLAAENVAAVLAGRPAPSLVVGPPRARES